MMEANNPSGATYQMLYPIDETTYDFLCKNNGLATTEVSITDIDINNKWTRNIIRNEDKSCQAAIR